jgi:hypothetical protein
MNSLFSKSAHFLSVMVVGAMLAATAMGGEPTAAPERLVVLLRGAGNWLDREAMGQLRTILPAEGHPLILTNSWRVGHDVLVTEQDLGSAVLLLSNVWTYGVTSLPEEDFWKGHGLTNAPMEVAVPGGSGYYLMIANDRVLPFVGRRGTLAPAAIWAWPALPVKLEGDRRKIADISKCRLVSFAGGTLNLNGWAGGFGVRQKWCLSAEAGLLSVRLEISVERD